MFKVTSERGFLPASNPLAQLPAEYKELEDILQQMPITKADGAVGLLGREELGKLVESGALPEYDVSNVEEVRLLHALFRDYTFLASAYLLEPCHKRFLDTGEYGLGRMKLPRCIAVPLCTVARKLSVRPFMEYALSYALMNWRMIDPGKGFAVNNMKLIRAFEGSQDEAGFVLVHVVMVSHTGALVEAALETLDGFEKGDVGLLVKGLDHFYSVLTAINDEMETMWKNSHSSGYNRFRTFIMGVKDQPMFPDGVVYEGVVDPETGNTNPAYSFRGESGANDSIVPLSDNLLGLTNKMPKNPLTEILRDFRSYRPPEHNAFLSSIRKRSAGLSDFAEHNSTTAALFIYCLDKIREFRTRHWNFTKEYIVKYSSHPRATGGSPIVTWLPNQLRVVLQEIIRFEASDEKAAGIKRNAKDQLVSLDDEVERLRVTYNQ